MNWKRFMAVMFALLVGLTIGSGRLAAQTQSTGDITGAVTDPSGGLVPGAKVTLKDETKGSTQDTTTNRDGAYRFYLLPPGPYTVTVTATGFSTQTAPVQVGVGQIATANFSMVVGAVGTTVTVTETAPLLSVDSGNVASTISQQTIAEVPNPGNDMSYIAQLSPGAVMNTGMGYGNFSSYGTPGTSNLFTLDGMDDNDPFLNLNNSGATNLLLGANEVQEASVVNGAYTGEYGTLAGAQVNYVTKSGGNAFHGNAVYYWNGSSLNASDWFLHAYGSPKSFDNANQWAASLGGPIKRDKAFFFANTEGLRVIVPTSLTGQVPTSLLEGYIMDPTNGTLAQNGLSDSLPFYQQAFSIWDAASTKNAAGLTNNITNGGCSSLNGTAIPAYLGQPAGSTFGVDFPCAEKFQAASPNFTHEWLLSGRVDLNATNNDRLFLRVGYDHGLQATYTNVLSPIFNAQSDQPQWQSQLNWTHTFSPTLVNQFIASMAWYSAIFTNANRSASLTAFPTTLTFEADPRGVTPAGDFTGSSLSSMGNALYDWPQGRNVTQYQFGDDVSKTLNNHTVKFGVKFRRNDVSDHDYGVLTSGRSFVDLGDFASGVVNDYYTEQAFPLALSQPAALYSLAGYLEDDWHVKPNLTLTFAARLEHYSNPVCQTDCFARLTGPFADVSHDPDQPYNAAINTGLHQALQGLQGVGFAPRFGFAYQPFGASHNLVVRGGIGIFYDQFPGQVVDNFSQNPPLNNTFIVGGFPIAQTQAGNVNSVAADNNTAFLTGFANGSTLAEIQGAAPFFSPPSIFTSNKNSKYPQYQKWSLEVQKGFGANTSLTVGYYGNHGIHELIVDPSLNGFGFGSMPATVPDARFSEVQFADTHSVSNYNGMTVSVTHRFGAAGTLSANYTYSHAFDEVSNGGLLPFVDNSNVSVLTPQIPGDYRNNYGPSDYDARHYLSVSYVYTLPIRKMLGGRGWAPLVDGWQVAGAIFARSGFPYTVVDGALGGLANNNYFGSVYPDFLGGPTGSCGRSAAIAGLNATDTGCLTTAQFPTPGSETDFGVNGLRNKYRGPGYTDVDFSLAKKTAIPHWEGASFNVAIQTFNLFNHPNFDQPLNDISDGAGGFGTIQSTISTPTSILGAFLGGDAAPRIAQLKASITF
jgi:hypothetical protein